MASNSSMNMIAGAFSFAKYEKKVEFFYSITPRCLNAMHSNMQVKPSYPGQMHHEPILHRHQ